MNIQNLNIGTRLMLAFGIFMTVVIVILALALSLLSHIAGSFTQINEHYFAKLNAASETGNAVRDIAVTIGNVVMTRDHTVMQAEMARFDPAVKKFSAGLAVMSTLTNDAEGKALLEKLKAQSECFAPIAGTAHGIAYRSSLR
ncbi:MCP four helix bundle domain-containing protein [Herbaspirillum seropedicae]|uniref:MCP four helix bundle domain-containing protein n=1 Tax=Herbaspirillum seropedicae TaxID=964 RepID=UPI0028599AD9|nr:MCP four helix bundle domain-containing protein [Herbaspirillum seropedicae]MDR6397526.1 phosphoglycerate-specific signal transduction histidine kinase [Herbaspirillum seropedicae]